MKRGHKFKAKLQREDESRIVDVHEEVRDPLSGQNTSNNGQRGEAEKSRQSAKQVHFAFLPDKYEPLEEEDEEKEARKAEKKHKKKKKYKKYRKNVGKALRFGWRCLVLGLQGFTAGYSAPFTSTSTLIPEKR
ncbi:uncharacterized protein C1orf115-like [Polypterus senegalus]|uniref:uncharacterized protein C1orf115-like n=1 Tax=Polypterus senegalus TaxID=55291 RepID=UPI001966A2A8|nr:uncharacterized protein C1orf115-like [Polypterus senegalus]XP_039594220.1 uncharacterized protein C1orf115-like [Polypterus senegalus]